MEWFFPRNFRENGLCQFLDFGLLGSRDIINFYCCKPSQFLHFCYISFYMTSRINSETKSWILEGRKFLLYIRKKLLSVKVVHRQNYSRRYRVLLCGKEYKYKYMMQLYKEMQATDRKLDTVLNPRFQLTSTKSNKIVNNCLTVSFL